MRTLTSIFVSILASAALATPDPTPDGDASVIHLRSDCDVAGSPLENCFESVSAVTGWLWGGDTGDRNSPPSANDRVFVHVGPGEFGQFRCEASTPLQQGWVTVIGSGREHTLFTFTGNSFSSAYCDGAIHVEDCTNLSFQDLTASAQDIGVNWKGDGRSLWTNVDLIGGELTGETCGNFESGLGWLDFGGLHYFFGSRVIAADGTFVTIGFFGTGESWFYGGEIRAAPQAETNPEGGLAAVHAGSGGDIRIFGSAVRAHVGEAVDSTFDAGFLGLSTYSGTVHMHGGVVNVDASASNEDIDVTAVQATQSAGFIHTPGTAFVVKAGGSGTATRAQAANGARIDSPFLWPASSQPPDVESLSGSDLFVDTDAGSSGGEAHLMVYDPACAGGGGPWRDMTDGACR